MKKMALTLLTSLLAIGTIGNTALASSGDIDSSTEIITEVENIANTSESVQLVDVDTLPEGSPVINFDTIEEFYEAVQELDEENKSMDNTVVTNVETTPQLKNTAFMAAAASSRTDRLKVFVNKSFNPLKAATQPTDVTVDLSYSYSSGKFTKINNIKSFGFYSTPTSWIQTDYNKSFYNSNKSVSVELLGYNLVGVNIGGFPLGAKVGDTISFKYTLGGTKTLWE